MSETAIDGVVQEELPQKKSAAKPLGLIPAALLSLAVIFAPRWVGKMWQRVPLWRAAVIAIVHLTLLVRWLAVLLTTERLWSQRELRNAMTSGWNPNIRGVIAKRWAEVWYFMRGWMGEGTYDVALHAVAFALLIVMLLAMFFFVLLPFAVRPGKNAACVRHVARAALLGTGLLHFWMAALTGVYAWLIWRVADESMPPVFGTACAVALLALWAMVRAVRVDYRAAADMPVAPDPRCDECGYDLHLADPAGRCPECGKPVEASLSPAYRQETAWEKNPSFLQLGVMARQTRDIVRRPQALFAGMTTVSGQRAAQRWMIFWMTIVGFAAFWVVPLLALQLKVVTVSSKAPLGLNEFGEQIKWSGQLVAQVAAGGLALGLFWAISGIMMVGIETAGVVGVAHFRGQKVPLSATVKVTCYSSPLMLLWTFLGGLQILGLLLAYQRGWMARTIRVEQIALVVSTAVAHIGGLLWFEWTVYRGLRGIRYANH